MAKLPIDLAGFKKTAATNDSTTLEHKDGHKIELSHKSLSPKVKEQLEKLMMKKGGAEPKKGNDAPEEKASAKPKKDLGEKKNEKAPLAFADGGKVPGGNGSPAIDKKAAKNISDSSQASGWQPHQWAENLKAAFSPAPKESPAPAMADGGEVPLEVEEIKPTDADAPLQVEAINQGAAAASPIAQAMDQGAPAIPMSAPASQEAAMTATASPDRAPASAPAAINDPYGYQTTAQVYTQGLNSQLGGLQQQANAEGAVAQGQAKALDEGQKVQQKLLSDYQGHASALQKEITSVTEDIKNGHIDPNHFMSSMGTGAKIATGIGLLLGGLGAGGTGGKNLALESLNHQIDRDIDAQKAEMGKKHNLVTALYQQYGNLTSATQMASAMSRNILADKIQSVAAQSGDKLAQARGMQAAGALRQQAANTVGGLAMKQTLLGGMQSGHVAPEQVVRAIVPEGQQAAAYKELGEAQSMVHAKDNIMGAFDRLNQLNTVGNRVSSPLQTKREVEALREPLVAGLSKATAGRFTEQDAGMLRPLFPAVGDSEATVEAKRNQIHKLISEKMNFPLLKTYGIDANSFGRYNGQGQSAVSESAPKLGK